MRTKIWLSARAIDARVAVLLPPPTDTFRAMWIGMTKGKLGSDFMHTVERTVYATAIAAVIAIPLGIFLGASERLYRSVEFVIDFFRSTPASAMFPLFLVLFGVGDRTKISVAAFGAALVILFNVAYGVMNARKTRLLAAKLKELNLGNVLIVVEAYDEKLELASRNLIGVSVLPVSAVDPVSLIRHERVLATVGAVRMLEEKLA